MGVLVKTPRAQPYIEASGISPVARAPVFTDVDKFLASSWDLAVEAAGQEIVHSVVPRCLQSGRSALITSIGALTDDELHKRLMNIAKSPNGGRLLIAAGALPGMDWMSSASIEEVEEVRITQTKQPEGWRGTP